MISSLPGHAFPKGLLPKANKWDRVIADEVWRISLATGVVAGLRARRVPRRTCYERER